MDLSVLGAKRYVSDSVHLSVDEKNTLKRWLDRAFIVPEGVVNANTAELREIIQLNSTEGKVEHTP
jgi:hypothetical protein